MTAPATGAPAVATGLAPPPAPVCFRARPRPATAPPAALDAAALPADTALALANALPFLRCGEESAVHAFGRRLARGSGAAMQAALDAITADEVRHAAWLEALAGALPAPEPSAGGAASAAFFRRLLTRDRALHFARIAALDLAVCGLLRPLADRHGALGAVPRVAAGFRSIRGDEARHVRVARDCARRLGLDAAQQHAIDLTLCSELAALLAPVRASLARLGIADLAPARSRLPTVPDAC